MRNAVHLLLAQVLVCCAGDLAVPDGRVDLYTGPEASVLLQDSQPLAVDLTLSDTAAPDSAAPDAGTPDSAAPAPDTGLPTGGPCPCTPPLLCINNACRAPCTVPTDPCKAVASCPPDHGCVPMTSSPGVAACLPAVAAGQPCSVTVFCAVNHVCGSVSGGPYICLPTCSTKGAACGTGGTCLEWQGCLFCSKP